MPEAGAGTQGHDLLWTMIAPFYAQAVDTGPPLGTEVPYAAHVRILSGSVVPDGLTGVG